MNTTINLSTLQTVCRTCSKSINLLPLQEDPLVVKILQMITELDYSTVNEMPQQICATCICKIIEIQNFAANCIYNDGIFKKYCISLNKTENQPVEDPLTQINQEIEHIYKPKEELSDENQIQSEPEELEEEIEHMHEEFPENNTQSSEDFSEEIDIVKEEPFLDEPDIKPEIFNELSTNSFKEIDKNPSISIESNKSKLPKCDVCGKKFKTPKGLRIHKLNHGDHDFKCEICLKSYTSTYAVTRHKRIHFKKKKQNFCDICFKSFRSSRHLSKHKLELHKNRSFRCKICFKTFNNFTTLKQHKFSHIKDGPYTCKICSENFTAISSLSRHNRRLHK